MAYLRIFVYYGWTHNKLLVKYKIKYTFIYKYFIRLLQLVAEVNRKRTSDLFALSKITLFLAVEILTGHCLIGVHANA